MESRRVVAAVSAALILSACTSTKQFADLQFKPPEGDYKLIVMRPEVRVGSITTGGIFEQREEWTDTARTHLLSSLRAQQATRGGVTKIADRREDAGDPERIADLDRLHKAVGAAIQTHKYSGLKLPTKADRFDWTLGQEAVEFGKSSGYDYALFLYAEDSFASTGRVALQAVGMLGCVIGACISVSGGRQAAYASLVDLKSGKIVWFNALASGVGDIRTPDGSAKMVDQLLAKMKPGKATLPEKAKAKKG